MGNFISVDIDLNELDDLLITPISLFKPSKIPCDLSQHLNIWRFFEDNQNPQGILTQAVNLTEPQIFNTKECYLVLLIYRRDSNTQFIGYPDTMLLTLESLNNLTPRGLENVFGKDNSPCVDTFFLPRHEQEENELHYMLFVWNGKTAGSFLKAFTVTKGFELDLKLLKGQALILQSLFSGISVHSQIIQQSPLITLERVFKNDNYSNRKPSTSAFLLNWLWSSNDHSIKPLFPMFKTRYLNNSERAKYIKISEEVSLPKINFPIKEKLEIKPKMAGLSLSGIKTREEERVQIQNFSKKELNQLDADFDVRCTNREEMKLKYYSGILSELDPGLYVGSDIIARDRERLKNEGITHIINCAANVCSNYFQNDFTYIHFFLKDSNTENIECVFYRCIEFIQNALQNGGKVFVHCMQGVSRSVTICFAYIIFVYKKSFEEIYTSARIQREICSPNIGFQVQLIWWYKRLFEEYDSLPISPRVFAIGSHQREQPHVVVARILTQPLYVDSEYLTLDSRGIFLIQSRLVTYIWIGNSIYECNKEIYLQTARKQYQNLCLYEKAKALIEVYEGEETEEFWALWNNERKCSGNNNSWNSWYQKLDCAHDEEPQQLRGVIQEEVEKENKPKLYIFPEVNRISIFDADELVEDAFICLCTIDKCYKWRGFDANINDKEENVYIRDVIMYYYGDINIKIIEENSGNESNDFLNYF